MSGESVGNLYTRAPPDVRRIVEAARITVIGEGGYFESVIMHIVASVEFFEF